MNTENAGSALIIQISENQCFFREDPCSMNTEGGASCPVMGAVFKTVSECARAYLGGFDSHTPPPNRMFVLDGIVVRFRPCSSEQIVKAVQRCRRDRSHD